MSVELLWSWLAAAPHLLLFPLVLVEGPLATVLAGSLVAAGAIALPTAALLALVADLTADTGFFLLGRLSRRDRGRQLVQRLGLSDTRRHRLALQFEQHLPAVLAGAKVADVAAVPVLLAAGSSGVGYLRFLGWSALLTAPKVAVLLTLGALFGDRVARHLDAGTAALLAAAVVAAYFTLRHHLHRSKGENRCAS